MTLNNKRVLVTGANGFVGKHLITKLLQEKADVYALDTSKSKRKRVTSYSIDLTDREQIKKSIKKIYPEIVFHLAAFPDKKPNMSTIEKTINVNVGGTANILEAVKEIKPLFINIGSYKEYGKNRIPFTEDMKLKPLSPYAISKAAGEMFCQMYKEIFNVPFVSLRFPTLYGPGQGTDLLIPHIITSCLKKRDIKTTEGKQKREVMYISDAINALIRVVSTPGAAGEIINIGTGKEVEIKTVIKKIVHLTRSPVKVSFDLPYRKNEIWHMQGSNKKAKNILKWEPMVSLEEGLRKTIGWYKKNDKGC